MLSQITHTNAEIARLHFCYILNRTWSSQDFEEDVKRSNISKH